MSGLAVPGAARAASGCLMRFRSASKELGKPRKSRARVAEERGAGWGGKGSFQSVALPSGPGEWNHLCLSRAYTQADRHTQTDRQADRRTHTVARFCAPFCMCVGGGVIEGGVRQPGLL